MLECRNLSVTYGRKIRALQEACLKVEAGEIVALIGANGAGKSTLLRTISGLHRADGGEVVFEGERIERESAHAVAALGIAHVPEGRRIFSRLTVQENLELGATLDPRRSAERRARLFEIFPRLAERREQLGGTLSGGEQQMLAIARALMSGPKLLMLDEPSMGLSPILVEKIFQTIREVSAGGVTILLVEQNARQSLSLAHRGYVLETGRIVLEGRGEELLHNRLVQEAYLGAS